LVTGSKRSDTGGVTRASQRRPRWWLRLAHLFVAIAGLMPALVCCQPRTEVIVSIDTNAAPDRLRAIRASLRAGMSADGGMPVQSWTSGTDGTIALPLSLRVVPTSDTSPDGVLTLLFDVDLGAGTAGEPATTFRRVARIAFTPDHSTCVRRAIVNTRFAAS